MKQDRLLEYLETLRSLGTVESDGRFTIDLERAEKILSEGTVAEKATGGLDKEKVAAIRANIRKKLDNQESWKQIDGRCRAERLMRKLEVKIKKAEKLGKRYVRQKLRWGNDTQETKVALKDILKEHGLVMEMAFVNELFLHTDWQQSIGSGNIIRIDLLAVPR